MAILTGLIASLGGSVLKGLVGVVKGLFTVKEKKLDIELYKETKEASLQIAWWDYLKSANSSVVNQAIRPAVMALVIGDYLYQLWFTGTYNVVTLVPAMELGGYTFGPITNGLLVTFVILFLFPLRSIEKILMGKN